MSKAAAQAEIRAAIYLSYHELCRPVVRRDTDVIDARLDARRSTSQRLTLDALTGAGAMNKGYSKCRNGSLARPFAGTSFRIHSGAANLDPTPSGVGHEITTSTSTSYEAAAIYTVIRGRLHYQELMQSILLPMTMTISFSATAMLSPPKS
ncbi:hypothetical protein K504DRAFT_502124 [Pleomassaria siparia CBS 279.74]|uniref:Uncharacterized protein n=1 Tax=Pleomassaria siparia CBS 279.74 TaxID=1314801 RepID=A0A6G1KAK7_9PLEO|nr:hypothetical protein K504DRAFT_502124 [Pleomassaria siparia CBS 279.74]